MLESHWPHDQGIKSLSAVLLALLSSLVPLPCLLRAHRALYRHLRRLAVLGGTVQLITITCTALSQQIIMLVLEQSCYVQEHRFYREFLWCVPSQLCLGMTQTLWIWSVLLVLFRMNMYLNVLKYITKYKRKLWCTYIKMNLFIWVLLYFY